MCYNSSLLRKLMEELQISAQEEPSLIETLDLLEVRERIRCKGIEGFIFDADETLFDSHWLFTKAIENFCTDVSNCLGLEYETVNTIVKELNDKVFLSHKVSPARWEPMIKGVIESLGVKDDELCSKIISFKAHFDQIYITPVGLKPSVVPIIEKLQAAGFPVFIVTHASDIWTYFKFENGALQPYIDREVIHTISVDEFKDHVQWDRVLTRIERSYMGLRKRENFMVIGDSLDGDILASKDAGIIHHGWLNTSDWNPLRNIRPVPSTAIVGSNLREIFNQLLAA